MVSKNTMLNQFTLSLKRIALKVRRQARFYNISQLETLWCSSSSKRAWCLILLHSNAFMPHVDCIRSASYSSCANRRHLKVAWSGELEPGSSEAKRNPTLAIHKATWNYERYRGVEACLFKYMESCFIETKVWILSVRGVTCNLLWLRYLVGELRVFKRINNK